MTPEEWKLLLDFVRAVAQPTATVLAVWIAARFAVLGFRKQKLLERRLDWYESMVQQLDRVAAAVSEPAYMGTDQKEALATLEEAARVAKSAFMYADERSYVAVSRWMEFTTEVLPNGITPQTAQSLQLLSLATTVVLMGEVRKDLRLHPVKAPVTYFGPGPGARMKGTAPTRTGSTGEGDGA